MDRTLRNTKTTWAWKIGGVPFRLFPSDSFRYHSSWETLTGRGMLPSSYCSRRHLPETRKGLVQIYYVTLWFDAKEQHKIIIIIFSQLSIKGNLQDGVIDKNYVNEVWLSSTSTVVQRSTYLYGDQTSLTGVFPHLLQS